MSPDTYAEGYADGRARRPHRYDLDDAALDDYDQWRYRSGYRDGSADHLADTVTDHLGRRINP